MKKILTILVIMMVATTSWAEEVTLEKTSFSDGTISSSSMSFDLDSYVSLSISTSTNAYCLYEDYIDVAYLSSLSTLGTISPATCTITFSTKHEAKIQAVELTFASENLSPSNSNNGYNSGSSTSGIVIDGTKATYSGQTSTLTLAFSTTGSFPELMITKIKVIYDEYTHVSTADEFATLVNNNAKICLVQDIDVSSLSATTSGYLFGTFTGKITGENSTGTDYTITGGSKPMFYNVVGAEISHVIFSGFNVSSVTSALARTSSGSTFSHVTMSGCTLSNSDEDTSNTGLISGYSDSDTLEYCTVDDQCSINGNNKNTGGLVGKANAHDKFIYCHNAGTVTVDNNNVGGIVGFINTNTNVERCLNTGTINGNDTFGGIVGNSTSSTISQSANTGILDYVGGSGYANYVGGIVGKTNSCTISYCLSFGTILYKPSYYVDPIAGLSDESTYSNNLWYCVLNLCHEDNLSEFGVTYDDIISGAFAFTKTNGDGEYYLYQDIDNNTFCTSFPNPLPAAGTIYSNILCNGTQSYSNKYHSTETHTGEADPQGNCIICGNYIGTGDLHIKSAAFLCELSKSVNSGTDYSNSKIYLDDDIDMTGADFTPIGTSDNPYSGVIFNGQGHRIKNLTVNTTGYAGLFGCVGGYNKNLNITIENVILDSSCSITSTGSGVAGFVGCVKSTSNYLCDIIIMDSGNEATITGATNVAGIVGAVYDNETTKLVILSSYNTGAINGQSESATLCGWAAKDFDFERCYNIGTLTGQDGSCCFYRYKSDDDSDITVHECYDVNGDNGTGITTLTADQVRSGYLCQQLNTNLGSFTPWEQDLENDAYPTFGTGGITYSRSMTNQWGTIYLPFNVTIDNDESYDFYSITGFNGSTLSLTKMTGTISAGTPAIIRMGEASKSSETGKYELSLTVGDITSETINNAVAVGGLTLTGAYTSTDITDKDGYIIANNAFWNIASIKGDDKVCCSPFRAWLSGTASSAKLSFDIGTDNPTALETLNAIITGKAEYYDLNGRKINDLKPGVNIVKMSNGETRKVLLK